MPARTFRADVLFGNLLILRPLAQNEAPKDAGVASEALQGPTAHRGASCAICLAGIIASADAGYLTAPRTAPSAMRTMPRLPAGPRKAKPRASSRLYYRSWVHVLYLRRAVRMGTEVACTVRQQLKPWLHGRHVGHASCPSTVLGLARLATACAAQRYGHRSSAGITQGVAAARAPCMV